MIVEPSNPHWIERAQRIVADLAVVQHWFVARAKGLAGEQFTLDRSSPWRQPRRTPRQPDLHVAVFFGQIITALEGREEVSAVAQECEYPLVQISTRLT